MRLFKQLHGHPLGHHHGRRFARGPHERHERHERHFGGGRGRLARFLEHGDLKMLVLHLINEQPRHGYEIIKAIEDLTGGAYAPSPGIVYPTLTLLEELGQVASTAEGTRKSFVTTEDGRQALAENQAEVTAILARIAAAQPHEPPPPIIRAMENLKTALRLKLGRTALPPETTKQIAALLDAAARDIEAL
jgi:DNA-binding PadR family transcriptional regulator